MKKLLIGLALGAFSISALAQGDVVKTCDATVNFEGNSQRYVMTVMANKNDQLSGKVENIDGGSLNYKRVEKTTNIVREGLSADLMENPEFKILNSGERFVVHALYLEKIMMSSGVNLKLVRSIDIYTFVEKGVNIGATAFAEARDINGEAMGSFMGGFLVAPCK